MAQTDKNTKNQHHVWRHYLDSWAAEGTFCFYRQRDKQLISTQPKSVASETYFYRMPKLSEADRAFLKAYIDMSPVGHLRKMNHEFVELTQLPFTLRDRLRGADISPPTREAMEKQLEWAERNLGERFHTGIEGSGQGILDALLRQDDSFYQDDTTCGDFLYFLLNQYFRTTKIRAGMSDLESKFPGHDPARTAYALSQISAVNVSASFFGERKRYRIVFLDNNSGTPLITGDQPVINLLNYAESDDMDLYYPLSPTLAIMYTKDAIKYPDKVKTLSPLEVEAFNYAIYQKSLDQIYSNDFGYLKALSTLPKKLS